MKKKEKIKKKFVIVLLFILKNIEIILGALGAFAAAILSIWGTTIPILIAAIGGVLGVLCIGSLRDRDIIDKLNAKILLFEESQNIDNFFFEKPDEGELIIKAKNEIFLLQESGTTIYTNHKDIICDFLKQGGVIRWVVVLGQDDNIVKLMSKRNFDLSKEGMQNQLNFGIERIKVIQNNVGIYAHNLEVRFFPYPTDITGVFIDTNSHTKKDKEALIRMQGFKVKYPEKIAFKINALNASNTYQSYKKQIDDIWKNSTKCILLTGNAGVGKSTLLKKIVQKIVDSKSVTLEGFLTSEIESLGNRTGFETKTLDNLNSGILADTKNHENKFILNKTTMNDVLIPTIKKANLNINSDLLIIDEIGPIQLQEESFINEIQNTLNNHRISILGIIAKDKHPSIKLIENNYRVKIIEVTEDNRDRLIDQIVNEFL